MLQLINARQTITALRVTGINVFDGRTNLHAGNPLTRTIFTLLPISLLKPLLTDKALLIEETEVHHQLEVDVPALLESGAALYQRFVFCERAKY